MDIIKRSTERPVLFYIVNFKPDIYRHHDRLSRTQVDSDDFCAGIDVPHIDAPDACAGPDVQDPLRIRANRGQMQIALRYEVEHGMHQIQPVEFVLSCAQLDPGFSFVQRNTDIVIRPAINYSGMSITSTDDNRGEPYDRICMRDIVAHFRRDN
jgi:hypothetical protein